MITINQTESEKSFDNGEKLYQIILNQYSLVRERNDIFTTRSQSLLGFAGIINTILVAIIMTLISNDKARELLSTSPYICYFYSSIIISFSGYILSIILALVAFRTTKYMPIPQINSKEFIIKFFQGEANLSIKHLTLQAYEAIEYYNKANSKKYTFLFFATVSLMIAIIFTAILGIFVLTLI